MQQQHTTTRPRVSRRLGMFRVVAAAALIMTVVTAGGVSNYVAHTPVAYAATDYCTKYDYRYQTIDQRTMWDGYGVALGYLYLCAYTAGMHSQNRVALWEPGAAQIGTVTVYLGGGDGLVNYCPVNKQCAAGVGPNPPDYARATYQGFLVQTNRL